MVPDPEMVIVDEAPITAVVTVVIEPREIRNPLVVLSIEQRDRPVSQSWKVNVFVVARRYTYRSGSMYLEHVAGAIKIVVPAGFLTVSFPSVMLTPPLLILTLPPAAVPGT